MKRMLSTVLSMTAVVGFFAIWSVAAYLLRPSKPGGIVLLPGPMVVLKDLFALFLHHGFTKDVAKSVLRIGLGMLCSSVPAFMLGVFFGVNRRVYRAASPLFAFAKYVPPVSLIPILILWLGIGLPQQIALLFVGTFFYLTVMVAETVANTPQTLLDAARTLGAKRFQLIWNVNIKNGIPEFVEHLRTMLGISWTYLVAVEMVAAADGIGRVIIDSQRYLQTGRVLAGVFMIGVLGVVCDELLQWTRWLLCPWKRDDLGLVIKAWNWSTAVGRRARAAAEAAR
ncbi:ABC transporter permease [Planctomycetota bacterium]